MMCALAGFSMALASLFVGEPEEAERSAPVGMSVRVDEVVLPGPRLEAKPIELEASIIVRVVNVFPHGDAFRYNFDWYGLEPGDYDLTDFLQRVDGSSTDNLPALEILVTSALPPGQVKPRPPGAAEMDGLGGYQLLIILFGVLWFGGLIIILVVGRRRRVDEGEAGIHRKLTLAERLRPLVAQALAGQLSRTERAELEMALLLFWRRKLGLAEEPPARALAKLRGHEEAAPLLVALEEWLHSPSAREIPNLDELLAPYRGESADALDEVLDSKKAV